MVQWAPGTIRYEATDLPMCAITAVTTSHIGRKQGFASKMTTRALEQGVADGCAVGALGMFEQGFYDLLGFGTAAYDHQLSFDPASLMVDHVPYRPPTRITMDQWPEMHQALAGRMVSHGSVVVAPPGLVEAEVRFVDSPFALGYRDSEGVLTHFVYGQLKGEYGPWKIGAIAYQNTEQLLELLRLLRELSDQFRSVKMVEPVHIQLQAMLRNPIREASRSERSEHESVNRSIAWWQLRMLDVEACVAARHWVGEPVRFNLTLTDPLEDRLKGAWRGVAGDYTVVVGPESHASRGHTPGLPMMSAGVGSFTRLWFGVRPPSTIAVSDAISRTASGTGPEARPGAASDAASDAASGAASGTASDAASGTVSGRVLAGVDAPAELLAALDDALLLPKPVPGWAF